MERSSRQRRNVAFLAAGAAIALLACTAGDDRPAACGYAGEADPAAAGRAPEALQTAEWLAAPDAELAGLLRPRRDVWVPDGSGLTSPGWRATEQRRFDELGARLPEHADGIRQVGVGRFARFQLAIWLEGAVAAPAELHAGRVVYREAFTATDLVVVATPTRVEELLLLRDETAPRRFTWRIELPVGLGEPRREPSGALIFPDRNGDAVLRVPAPFALDAAGRRRAADLAFVAGRLEVVLDGAGLSHPILLDPAIETAVWDQRVTNNLGVGTINVSIAYDVARAKTVRLRGFQSTFSFPYSATYTDTWSGSVWTDASPSNPPSGRANHAMAYDGQRQNVVLFGGWKFQTGSQVYFDDTLVWNGTDWSPLNPSTKPSARGYHAMAYDSNRRYVVLFGGATGAWGSTPVGETWEWDGSNWAQRSSVHTPSPRRDHGMTFDSWRNVVVLTGGGGTRETWEWNGTDWTQRADVPVAPVAVGYDSMRHRVVAHGGSGNTWEWDGTTWTQVPGSGPPNSGTPSMAFDAGRRRLLLISTGSCGETSCPFTTWEYHNRGGACTTSSPLCDTPGCVDGVCCEQAACSTCQRCDTAGSPGQCATVTNQDDDTCTGNYTCNGSGQCKLKQGKSCPSGLGSDCVTGLCVDGVCCAQSCGTCQRCDATGVCVAVTNGDDDSCTGDTTCDGSGACKKKQGRTCQYDTDCVTAHCADGVCCNVACNDLCRSCLAANQAAGTDGTCGFVKPGVDPRAVCPDDGASSCGRDGLCDGAGACRLYAPTTVCGTTACVGNDVTTYACNGTGTCVPTPTSCGVWKCASGTCTTACISGVDCAPDAYCDGTTCRGQAGLGATCTGDDQCASNHCVDGVCCDGPCTGVCQACSAAGKASGADGECGFAKNGVDPHGDCPDDGAASCDRNGTCDGTGACAIYPAGFECLPSGCLGNVVTGYQCDGAGTCTATAITDCGLYRCAVDQCTVTCTASSDCASDAYCDEATSQCVARLGTGVACTGGGQCGTGFCVDGVCCNSTCGGQCEACDLALAVGTCTPVTGEPRGDRPACPGAGGTDPCAARTCDGSTSTTTCAGFVGTEVVCRADSCTAGVETRGETCDGTGACPPERTQPCDPYACGPTSCLAGCDGDDDCGDPATYRCDAAAHLCEPRPGAQCDGQVIRYDDGTTKDCAPYQCQVATTGAECKTTCSGTTDCVLDYVCDTLLGQGTCVPAEENGPKSGGCGVAPARAGAMPCLLLLLALVTAARARRGAARAGRDAGWPPTQAAPGATPSATGPAPS
jgi:hypothetical protein